MTIRTDADLRVVERFIVSVGAMRKAQKSSFRYRDGVMKAHAMQLEQEVDRQLDAWERERVSAEMREQHPELFPGY